MVKYKKTPSDKTLSGGVFHFCKAKCEGSARKLDENSSHSHLGDLRGSFEKAENFSKKFYQSYKKL